MRLALLADVHANLHALDAVLSAIDLAGVDRILCLGDVVGYNAKPQEVVDRLRARRDLVAVAGNHDRDLANAPLPGTSAQARRVSDWTRERLDDEARGWIAALPNRLSTDEWVGVHGCYLNDTHVSGYVTDTMLGHNLRAISARGYPRLAFCGHTHAPMLGVLRRGEDLRVPLPVDRPVALCEGDEAILVNPGSVGQPRDGDPRASFAVVDLDARTVTLRRVAYDVAGAAESIVAAGLPTPLADRLREGR